MYVNSLGCHQSDIHNSYRKPFMDLDITICRIIGINISEMSFRKKTVDKQSIILYPIPIREIQTNVHFVHSGSFCQIFLTQQSNMAGTRITK